MGWTQRVAFAIGAALALLLLACSGSSGGDGAGFACHYKSHTSTVCSGYSNFDSNDGCVEVDSKAKCNDYTKSSTYCGSDCCSDTNYTDVSLVSGTCASTSGTGGSGSGGGGNAIGGSGGGSSACPAAQGDSACTTCYKTYCCAEATACNASQACSNLVNCISNCATGDTACIQSCDSSYPNGVAPLNTFATCLSSSCSSQCS